MNEIAQCYESVGGLFIQQIVHGISLVWTCCIAQPPGLPRLVVIDRIHDADLHSALAVSAKCSTWIASANLQSRDKADTSGIN